MYAYAFRNADEALPEMIRAADRLGIERPSRNGPVKQFPEPVAIRYTKPTERVVFHAERDANPFFHLMEAVWMLAGRNDVAFPATYVKTFGQFSDDGKTFNGAYGFRWRHHFGSDQISTCIRALRENKEDRRHVISMYDGRHDLGLQSKDIPCNLTATVQIGPTGALDLTVYNRSNDLIWGALGANAVHFSVLQEYMAHFIGVPVGAYEQVSANMHVYLNDVWEKVKPLDDLTTKFNGSGFGYKGLDPYSRGLVEPSPMGQNAPTDEDVWWQDLNMFLDEGPVVGLRVPWLRRVVVPVFAAHQAYREGAASNDPMDKLSGIETAMEILRTQCRASDWRAACEEWLLRRQASIQSKLAS